MVGVTLRAPASAATNNLDVTPTHGQATDNFTVTATLRVGDVRPSAAHHPQGHLLLGQPSHCSWHRDSWGRRKRFSQPARTRPVKPASPIAPGALRMPQARMRSTPPDDTPNAAGPVQYGPVPTRSTRPQPSPIASHQPAPAPRPPPSPTPTPHKSPSPSPSPTPPQPRLPRRPPIPIALTHRLRPRANPSPARQPRPPSPPPPLLPPIGGGIPSSLWAPAAFCSGASATRSLPWAAARARGPAVSPSSSPASWCWASGPEPNPSPSPRVDLPGRRLAGGQ